MEQFWRNTGVQLGKHWKVVAAVMVALTAVLALGATRIEFATGQDSYLNPDSQIAIDNVAFQDDFGGETIILLFSTEGEADITDLFEGENLTKLQDMTAELEELEGDGGMGAVFSTVTPYTSLTYSSALVGGPTGTQALTSAVSRDEAGAEARNEDISISLARRGAVGPDSEWNVGNPAWNEVLIFDNTGYTLDDAGDPVAPPEDELVIRKSLRGTFPNVEGGPVNGTAVGGVVLLGNASLDELTEATDAVLEILEDPAYEFDGFELTVTGSPIYLGEINDYLKGGMLTLGLAALAVMAVVLALMFRVRWRLLPLLAVFIGVLWAFSLLGLIGIDLSLVTISGLPILIGVGIDFAIQIHNRVEEEVVLDRAEHPIANTLANVAPPLIVATITGVLAFLALRISKVPMIRDFGVLLAVGIVVLVVVGIVVPASVLGIREWTKPTEERGDSLVERAVVKLGGLPTKLGLPMIILASILFIGGVLVEGRTKIQSDPIRWIDQGSQTVKDIDRLADETEFATTLGVLVASNNVLDQNVVDLIFEFTVDAEARDEVVATSSLVGTLEKIIDVDGGTRIAPTTADVVIAAQAAEEQAPAIRRALINDPVEPTAAQVNLRLEQDSLEDRAELVEDLEDDLQARIDELDIPDDSILRIDISEGQAPIKATPAGLATVGIGLLENLSANRANLTYLALAAAALWLVLRFRSLSRALLGLVPVLMAVGASSLFVGLLGFELSPLTTVSGPLIIATCAEFSVLIMGRYLEERQRGLEPRVATDTAAKRTGRAFFTSAMTTIGGFAVLVLSPLPLLRDFGIIVTLNVAIALLAALVAMPPLLVWIDEKGLLGTQEQGVEPGRSVRLAAIMPGKQTVGAVIGVVLLIGVAIGVYATADTDGGEAEAVEFDATPLPTTTTTTTTTIAPPETEPETETEDGGPAIDPSTFGTERPATVVGGVLFDLLTSPDVGVEPNVANCAIETLASRISDDELLALGAATAEPAAVEFIEAAALDCGITQNQVDRAIAIQRGEEPPPVEQETEEADGTLSSDPEIDPSGFSADPPTDPIQGTVFNLLVGGGGFEGQGIDPMVANCAIETTIVDHGDATLTQLAAGDPTAVENVKSSVARCGVAPEVVDGALAEFTGG
ncbi:efflux RND transporter permease subunit [Ilumatobacter nonamiensis]|uniref:efflux RND transporter permease subunit n=1 Tax=Ilumatobacter nonamiensis TaxID=467093 RepID=UPI001F4D081E|nr:MMPL family transporter [Ilumatobacter nonamiensis]